MNEVLNSNFDAVYPRIENAINNAAFIAIDAEMSGIHSERNLKNSLFDTLNDRYMAWKRNIQQFVIVQFGITTFYRVPSNNAYKADSFSFYLFPRSIPLKNRQLSWEVEAIDFLYKHGFDFNKFLVGGISYIDEIDESLLRNHIVHGDVENYLSLLSYDEEENFKECKSKVYEWISNKLENAPLKLEVITPMVQYVLHKDLRNNYNDIWITSDNKSINVMKISSNAQDDLFKKDNLEEALLGVYLGFSKVFKLLSSSKKTIIGHNILLDLMFMHQQFYKPLPDSYKEFKSNIHTLFPQIYDTKFLSFELRKLYSRDEVNWKINSLNILYEYFTTQGRITTYNSPEIIFNEEFSHKKNYHSAGWDSYFCGYVFVKMAHIFCVKKFGTGLEERTASHSELMSSVKDFINSINVTRGNEMYMKLDGEDPMLSRPQWLHVKLKSPSLDIKQLMEKFSSYGSVDVMPFARRRVLVAVSSHNTASEILQRFKNSEELQVARYNRIKHATSMTIFLWSGAVLSGGVLAWMLKNISKTYINQ
ncbi:pre-piRNA 3'-exonuclease trimmer isoform X2 [Bombus vancouverensis nearcticus]|uniref:pre-piRNA 3'-exonuclease trimmer isoform X2 n=2 Tax=Bombus vancouverensis nearcticus TaxID=2705178 RepID=UPI00143C4F03|nr:pre-piRNA 3'-exonuclease trimmer-like isoform X1 [Bombus vancouverensis nearcticus]